MEKNLLRASWDHEGKRIAAGGGDRTAVVWETRTGKLLHKLPGHKGAVNDVRFHPLGEPISMCFPLRDGVKDSLLICGIVVSASSDRNLIVGELGK